MHTKAIGGLIGRGAASLLVGLAAFLSAHAILEPQQADRENQTTDSAASTTNAILIPDGATIEMRFAQAVRGKMIDPVDVGVEAKTGETVRLVAAADVRIGKNIVIAEGAIAQATVIQVKKPLTTLVATGLGLQLDWIEDVTGGHIPLRILRDGKPEPFMVQVVSAPGGAVARPETLHGDILGKNAVDFTQMWRDRYYIPAGTRITVYVQGAQTLDLQKVEEAQSRVSFSEATTADVVIYRTKGHAHDRVRIRCDENLGRPIGEREYIRLDVPAGKHRCQIENQSAREIAVEAGQEYFFHLQHSGSGWELKPVTVGEGEDGIENGDPAPKY